jgi:hypothetical protein
MAHYPMDENAERRRFPRLAINVGVHCNSFDEGRIVHQLSNYSENLGVGGLSVRSEKKLPQDLSLLVSFFLPIQRRSVILQPSVTLPVIARSRVAWCRPVAGDFLLGLEFLDINRYSRNIFKAFLDLYQLDGGPLLQEG